MTLEEVKRVDLVDYAKSRLSIACNEKGMAHCPFHEPDNTPSFSIFKADDGVWLWKDHHDGASGTIVDLVARIRGITDQQAIADLRDEFRGVSQALTVPSNGAMRSHTYRDRDQVPVFKKEKYADGRYAWFHRADGGWKTGKGSALAIPYNLDKFRDEIFVVICEGEKDADTVMAIGDEAVLATSAPNGKGSWPDDLTPHFKQFKNICFLYDVGNDEDVKKHARKLIQAFPQASIYMAKVPLEERESDITDYLNAFEGKDVKTDALTQVLQEAQEINFGTPGVKEVKRIKQAPILIKLSSVEPEAVEWLWPRRFPLGKISFIAGQPGQGKSYFSLFMATQVTRGGAWPDDPGPAKMGSVIILSAEDGVADTIKPRALAMGADTERIIILDGVKTEGDGCEFFDVGKHIPALESAVLESPDTRLVIIDPISAYMGRANCHTNSEVRGCLAPLVSLASRHKIAVVCITHLNKAEGLSAMSRVMDSLAFIATARMAWLIGADPKDPTGERKLLALLKANLSGRTKGLAFRIAKDHLVFEEKEIDVDPNGLLVPGVISVNSSLSIAKEWLAGVLASGPVPSDETYGRARDEGIPAHALERARKELGVRPRKEGFGQAGRWVWELPRGRENHASELGRGNESPCS